MTTAKTPVKPAVKKPSPTAKGYPYLSTDKRPDYYPDKMVIKEVMHQKDMSENEAISLLRNPAD